jgi:hypothetical protein
MALRVGAWIVFIASDNTSQKRRQHLVSTGPADNLLVAAVRAFVASRKKGVFASEELECHRYLGTVVVGEPALEFPDPLPWKLSPELNNASQNRA